MNFFFLARFEVLIGVVDDFDLPGRYYASFGKYLPVTKYRTVFFSRVKQSQSGPTEGGTTILLYICKYLPVYTAWRFTKLESSIVVINVEAGLLFTTFRDFHGFSMQNVCIIDIVHKYLEHCSGMGQWLLWAKRPRDRGSFSTRSSDLSLFGHTAKVVSGAQFGCHPLVIVG